MKVYGEEEEASFLNISQCTLLFKMCFSLGIYTVISWSIRRLPTKRASSPSSPSVLPFTGFCLVPASPAFAPTRLCRDSLPQLHTSRDLALYWPVTSSSAGWQHKKRWETGGVGDQQPPNMLASHLLHPAVTLVHQLGCQGWCGIWAKLYVLIRVLPKCQYPWWCADRDWC